MSDRIIALYRIETPLAIDQAAESIAGEQSSGTFVAVPGETAELRARHRARVESVTALEPAERPSLPGARPAKDGIYRRAEVKVSFPFENVGTNLPTLVATVLGNLFELAELSGLRLLDLELPGAFGDAYPGPQFGCKGTRDLSGVEDRPLIGTIVKPSVGLSPEATGELVRELALCGIDFVKDDELMADPPHSPFARRVECVMRAIDEAAEKTGRKTMYAFNITADLDDMLRHHDTVLEAGGTCVMVSLHSIGLAGVERLRRHFRLPIHGHRNGWGMLTRFPWLGLEFRAAQKLWRLAGVDHLHVNGLRNKFWEPDASVVRSIESLREPLFPGRRDDTAMPVISSGQWAGQAPDTYRLARTADLIYLAGGGLMAHPDGPAAGLASIRQAWEAALSGASLEQRAKEHRELARALEKYGALDRSREGEE